MPISVFDLFRIGIGPSSSHTVGPMRAARRFVAHLAEGGAPNPVPLETVARIRVQLFGSLGATGVGHGTITAIILGLTGAEPHSVDPDAIEPLMTSIAASGHLRLFDRVVIAFDPSTDLVLHGEVTLPGHPNGMTFEAFADDGSTVWARSYYSVGGGFVVDEDEIDAPINAADVTVAYPYRSADELVAMCTASGLSIAGVKLANECSTQSDTQVSQRLLVIWRAMQDCVQRGYLGMGELPGGLHVQRRAAALHRTLTDAGRAHDPLAAIDWVNLYALAVNEENAAGGRVVTAPTNGAAGIVPAVLHYYTEFIDGATDDGVVEFLLTAGAIGALFKMNASISGAEVGCQGEVGSACAMAAAGLAHVLGGTPEQVENAAEIALEHNLGLTCDPIGGLVQVPCIERNAMASMKAINAARLALHGDGTHLVSLDQAISTMRDTGRDMHEKYKETARGGLAVTFRNSRDAAPVPLNIVEC